MYDIFEQNFLPINEKVLSIDNFVLALFPCKLIFVRAIRNACWLNDKEKRVDTIVAVKDMVFDEFQTDLRKAGIKFRSTKSRTIRKFRFSLREKKGKK